MRGISPYHGLRVTVLGASGFIGRWVVHALAHRGAVLHVVGRDRRNTDSILREWGVAGTVVTADLAEADTIRNVIANTRPAITFNLSGYGVDPSERDPVLAAALNRELPPALARAMAEHSDQSWHGQHVVHAGSALEYGIAAGNLNELTPPMPTTLYGRTKLDGTLQLHETARQAGVRAVTGRLFTVYGPGEHDGRLLPTLLAASRTTVSIPLSAGTQSRDFTYVGDVVDGLLRLGALTTAPPDVVNVATGTLTSVRRFAEIAAGVLGIAPERLAFGAIPARAEEMRHDPVSVERLRVLTGWTPATSIAEGLAKTLAFLAKHTPQMENGVP